MARAGSRSCVALAGVLVCALGGAVVAGPEAVRASPELAAPARLTPGALDALVARALARASRTLPPAQSPELLLRRLSFDLTGRPPRPVEVDAVRTGGEAVLDQWLARTEASPRPRKRLAERLAALLVGRRGRLQQFKFEDWLAAELERDRRVLLLWSRIVSANGVYPDAGAGGWFVRFQGDPAELTTQVARAMLGESMGCARCHDHPFARWKRMDFLGLAASFAQVGFAEQIQLGEFARFKVWDRGWGDVYLDDGRPVAQAFPAPRAPGAPSVPASGKVTSGLGSMGPASLGMRSGMTTGADGAPAPAASPDTAQVGPPRRARLAEWLSRPDNPMPPRALANRVWGWTMGRPLVTPVYDLEMGVEELPGVLDALARHLAASGGDVLELMQVLLRTRAYRARREDAGPFPPRRLSLEELAAALERLAERPAQGGDRPRSEARVEGDRRGTLGELLENAGAEDLGEAADATTVARGLFLVGGGPLSTPEERVDVLAQRVEAERSDAGAAGWLFDATLARAPRPAERAWLSARLDADPDRQRALGDALWALVNCAEFGVSR